MKESFCKARSSGTNCIWIKWSELINCFQFPNATDQPISHKPRFSWFPHTLYWGLGCYSVSVVRRSLESVLDHWIIRSVGDKCVWEDNITNYPYIHIFINRFSDLVHKPKLSLNNQKFIISFFVPSNKSVCIRWLTNNCSNTLATQFSSADFWAQCNSVGLFVWFWPQFQWLSPSRLMESSNTMAILCFVWSPELWLNWITYERSKKMWPK